MSNNGFRQQRKYLDVQSKKNDIFHEYGNYPKSLTLNMKYFLKLDGFVYVIIIKEKRKDRAKRCYYYKAKVEKFVEIIREDNNGTEYYSWNLRSGGMDIENTKDEYGLQEIKHSSSYGYYLKHLTDAMYAKLFLTMDAVNDKTATKIS